MAEERAGYRWWVLLNTFLVFSIAFGMGWTYIVMVAAEVIKDLNLTLMDWGTLWSAVSLGALVFAIIGGALGDRFGDLDGFDEHAGLTAIRIVHHYLMGGWGLEDTPTPGVLLADTID